MFTVQVHGSRFTVRGSRFEVHGSRFTVRGSRVRGSGFEQAFAGAPFRHGLDDPDASGYRT
jgi:hypothetical protein